MRCEKNDCRMKIFLAKIMCKWRQKKESGGQKKAFLPIDFMCKLCANKKSYNIEML